MNLCKFISLICHNSFKILKEDMDIGQKLPERLTYIMEQNIFMQFYTKKMSFATAIRRVKIAC